MNQEETFYSAFEGFPCKSGCTACCKGVVSLAIPELENIFQEKEEARKQVLPTQKKEQPVNLTDENGMKTQTLTQTQKQTTEGCPFRTSLGCSVYHARPFMCRLFGFQYLHPEMHVQPFCTRVPLMRPGDAEATLLNEYLKWCDLAGFVIIGEPLDSQSKEVLIGENRRATERAPGLIKYQDVLTGKERCFS